VVLACDASHYCRRFHELLDLYVLAQRRGVRLPSMTATVLALAYRACRCSAAPKTLWEENAMDQLELAKLFKRAAGMEIAQPKQEKLELVRVMTYARASTRKQELSVPDQLRVLEVFRSEQKGWESVAILSEVQSGKRQRKRVEFAKVKAAIRKREVDVVLAHDMSRFGRSFSDLIKFMELAEQNGVEIWTAKGRVPYITGLALALVADLQLGMTREQIKRAHFSITMDGLHIGGRPYGYRYVMIDGRKGHLVIVKDEAKIVRLIFKLYLQGKSPRAICRILNRMNVPSPKGKKWRVAILTKDAFRGILHNIVYKGFVAYNVTEKIVDAYDDTVSHELRPIEDWKIEKGKHKPIIKAAVFDAAQEVYAKRKRIDKSPPGPLALFAGRLKCPACLVVNEDGSTTYGTMGITGGGRNRQIRVRCNGISQGHCENTRSYIRSEIHETVLKTLRTHLSDPKVIVAFLREHASLSKAAFKHKGKEAARLEKEVVRLGQEQDNLVKAIRQGGDAELLNAEIFKIQKGIAKAQQIVQEFEAGTYDFQVDAASADRYLKLIDDVLKKLSGSPANALDKPLIEELNSLVDRIVVYPDKDDRGFEVEVVGKLAQIVTGTDSFRGKHSSPKHILRLRTLTIGGCGAAYDCFS
jgi:DNA invertase Pin-like site-specific DNA recombinase